MTNGPEIIHTRLVGGPAHGQRISISTAFATVCVLGAGARHMYERQRFLVGPCTYELWVWPGLTHGERLELAAKELGCG